MIVKCTLLFQQASGQFSFGVIGEGFPQTDHRVAGWSESYYYDGPGGADLFARVTGQGLGAGSTSLCEARARLLPVQSGIVGQRYQQLDPKGRSQSGASRFPGSSGILNDVPQMALLCKIPTSDGLRIRQLVLRGIPDARVVNGEYQASQQFRADLQNFFNVLSGFSMRSLGLGLTNSKTGSIDASGLFTSSFDLPVYAVGDRIRFENFQNATGQRFFGNSTVKSVGPGPNQLVVQNWTLGALTGGRIFRYDPSYPFLDGSLASISRIVVRKVGRPFDQYRGRSSNRRRLRRAV